LAKKTVVLKKLNPILSEADALKSKKNYVDAVRKYREGINFLRLKATDMEGREDEVNNIMAKIDDVHCVEIDDIIANATKLADSKKFNESIQDLNRALKVADNIDNTNLKNKEISVIKLEIRKTDLKSLIEEGIKTNEKEEFDNALGTFKRALNDANDIFSSDVKNSEIIRIKELINQTHSKKIKVKINDANDLKQNAKLNDSIKEYEIALKIAKEMFESKLKDNEVSNLENLINQVYTEKIAPILENGKELINQGKSEDSIDELNKAIKIAEKMFETPLKKSDLKAIGELINPLLAEKISSIKEKGLEITREDNFIQTASKINDAAEIFNDALSVAKNMVDSADKDKQIRDLSNLIEKMCSSGIKIRKEKGIELIKQKQYEKAISEMYSALSIAKNMVNAEEDNKEIAEIKDLVNQIYSSEIDDVLEKAKELLKQKQFENAREIFNEAMTISNKMYLSEAMEKEIGKIKNLLYQSEMKQIVAGGYVSEEQKKFEKQLEDLQKELEEANLITDPERRSKKISEVKLLIDNVYSDQIKLIIEQGNLYAEQNIFDASEKEIDKTLMFVDLIEYTVVKDNELKKIIEATYEYGNLLAKKNTFDNAFKFYDKALSISQNIKDKDIKNGKIKDIKLFYEKELDNKVKQDIKNGKFDIAVKYCEKAISLDEKYAESYQNLGNAYIYKKEYGNAIENFKRVVELVPNHVNAWNDMGLACELKGDYDNALKSLNSAIEIDSNNSVAWFRRGNVYKSKNESSQAIDNYRNATELDQNHAKSWLFLGSIYYENKDYDNAMKCFDKAIQLDSGIKNQINTQISEMKKLIDKIQQKLIELFKNKY